MARQLQKITWEGDVGEPAYLYFSNHAVVRTQSFLDGAVAVDFDKNGEVIGIEMLYADPSDWAVVGQIAAQYDLRFDLFFASAEKPKKVRSKASR